MGRKAQLGVAAFVASVAAIIVPVCGGLWYVFGPPVLNADGSPDNAPIRGAGLFLFASPILALVLVGYFAVAPLLLRRIHRLTLSALVALNIVPSLAVALLFGVPAFRGFGPLDGAILFGLFGGFSILFLGVGSAAWWLVAPSQGSSAGFHPPAV